MPTDDHTRRARRSVGTARLAALSDGVFAIAMTLLVLDIAVRPPGTPWQQLLNAWPIFAAYLVSFLTLGAAWVAHTHVTDRLARADPLFVRLNMLALLVVTFLPFPTRLSAEALDDVAAQRVAITLYGLTLMAIRLLVAALDRYARREGLYAAKTDDQDVEDVPRKLWPSIAAYLIAIVVGIVLPDVAVALYFGIAVYLLIPFREVAQLLRHPRASTRASTPRPPG